MTKIDTPPLATLPRDDQFASLLSESIRLGRGNFCDRIVFRLTLCQLVATSFFRILSSLAGFLPAIGSFARFSVYKGASQAAETVIESYRAVKATIYFAMSIAWSLFFPARVLQSLDSVHRELVSSKETPPGLANPKEGEPVEEEEEDVEEAGESVPPGIAHTPILPEATSRVNAASAAQTTSQGPQYEEWMGHIDVASCERLIRQYNVTDPPAIWNFSNCLIFLLARLPDYRHPTMQAGIDRHDLMGWVHFTCRRATVEEKAALNAYFPNEVTLDTLHCRFDRRGDLNHVLSLGVINGIRRFLQMRDMVTQENMAIFSQCWQKMAERLESLPEVPEIEQRYMRNYERGPVLEGEGDEQTLTFTTDETFN